MKISELRRVESFENPTLFLLANQLIKNMETFVSNAEQCTEMFGDSESNFESFYGLLHVEEALRFAQCRRRRPYRPKL